MSGGYGDCVMKSKTYFVLFTSLVIVFLIFFFINRVNTKKVMVEDNQIYVRWPESIWTGDKEHIQVGMAINSSLTGSKNASEMSKDNLDQYFMNIEARIDVAGLGISPAGVSSQNIFPGQQIQFSWEITPQREGDYEGVIWIFLNLIPKDKKEESKKEILLAKTIEIQTRNYLGMNMQTTRILAALSLFVSGISFTVLHFSLEKNGRPKTTNIGKNI